MARGSLWALAVGVLGLAASGCEEPAEMVPVAAPGTPYTRTPPPEKEEPQALGEGASRTPTDQTKKKAVAGTISPPTEPGQARTTPSGVKYETLKPGDGAEIKPGQSATVHYTGTLADGTVFDKNEGSDKPASFPIGKEAVIAGWDEAVPGMKVGERRKMTIPPELAYGATGSAPKVPANATLTFEVELLGIQ
jgi:FKBP-type peptidyl-prolyl cis-trans isomerase